jgi:TRAP-type C4-dicarboxylate transport system permease small subunit
MNPEVPLPLAFLAPGAPFLLVLSGIVAIGVALHALLVRRFGAERFDSWTRQVEGALFCVFLAVMLGISGLQVILRNFFRSGVLWFDPLVRSLVLWVAFLGAMTATSHARHLHIDVLHRALPAGFARPVSRLLSVASAACCALLANGSYVYLREEYHYGVSPFLGVPSWAAQSILLWGFALLAYRFLVQAIWPAPREFDVEPAAPAPERSTVESAAAERSAVERPAVEGAE